MSDFREVSFSPLGDLHDQRQVSGRQMDDEEVQTIHFQHSNAETSSMEATPSKEMSYINASSSSEQQNHHPEGGSTVWGASFNFVNSIVGAGIIGKHGQALNEIVN